MLFSQNGLFLLLRMALENRPIRFYIGRLEEAMKRLSIFALFALCVAAVVAAAGLPFISDNYGAALSEAKQRHVPIFVEVWAPW
jgi:hypothetical protein